MSWGSYYHFRVDKERNLCCLIHDRLNLNGEGQDGYLPVASVVSSSGSALSSREIVTMYFCSVSETHMQVSIIRRLVGWNNQNVPSRIIYAFLLPL